MQLNKLRLYNPRPSKSSSGLILDDPYDTGIWQQDQTHGSSRNAISRLIESMGFFGNVAIVDKMYGNDYTARVGNINKPFYSHSAAISMMDGPGTCITMPGVYRINSIYGFPIQDGVDHFLMNATIEVCYNSYCYGSILTFPYYMKCRFYGKGTIRNLSSNGDWAFVTPYMGCDMEFEGIRFEGAKQIVGQSGANKERKTLRFKNCELVSTGNSIPAYLNAGNYNAFGDTQTTFENCYIKGGMLVSSYNAGFFDDDFMLKFYRCHFEAIDNNINGQNASVTFLDYYNNQDTAKYLFHDCSFKSNQHNLYCGHGYGGAAANNKYIVINNCRFVNGPQGWIINNNANYKFKIMNSFTTNSSTGSPVNNLLSGNGMITEPNLEIELYG